MYKQREKSREKASRAAALIHQRKDDRKGVAGLMDNRVLPPDYSQEAVIQGWWPLGHRTITKKVLNDDDSLSKIFDEAAKDFLIARSPDMDFIQDETNAMEKGIKDSAPKIKDFKKYAAAKDPRAQSMWENNELHQRPQWYMLHHGEGGFYKEEGSAAASKNRAMTESLVKLAADMYNAGNIKAALSILSDAIHQAEDRGSHQEGEKFRGHDIRQTIESKYVDPTWEQEGYKYVKKPDPDNASVNPEGAKKALFLASAALQQFSSLIKGDRVAYREDAASAAIRHSKVKVGHGLGRLVAASKKVKTKIAGHTDVKTIEGIEKKDWKAVEDVKATDLSKDNKAILRRAFDTYIIGWLTSELMENIRVKKPGSKKILAFAYKTFDELIKKNSTMVAMYTPLGEDERQELVTAAIKNYQYQRAGRYQGNKPAEVMDD